MEGFSYGDRRILHKERPLSRIWTTFCILCKHTTEVCKLYIPKTYLHFIFVEKDVATYLQILIRRVGRNVEAKDAARVALRSPWWTLGCPYEV